MIDSGWVRRRLPPHSYHKLFTAGRSTISGFSPHRFSHCAPSMCETNRSRNHKQKQCCDSVMCSAQRYASKFSMSATLICHWRSINRLCYFWVGRASTSIDDDGLWEGGANALCGKKLLCLGAVCKIHTECRVFGAHGFWFILRTFDHMTLTKTTKWYRRKSIKYFGIFSSLLKPIVYPRLFVTETWLTFAPHLNPKSSKLQKGQLHCFPAH